MVTAAIFCLSEVIPPWLYKCDTGFGYPAGYHFFRSPPEPKEVCISSDPLPAPPPTVLKNSARLNVQRSVLVVLTAGLLLVLRSVRSNLHAVAGFLALCVSVVGLMFLGLMIRLGI
jgi:hypothetical protein